MSRQTISAFFAVSVSWLSISCAYSEGQRGQLALSPPANQHSLHAWMWMMHPWEDDADQRIGSQAEYLKAQAAMQTQLQAGSQVLCLATIYQDGHMENLRFLEGVSDASPRILNLIRSAAPFAALPKRFDKLEIWFQAQISGGHLSFCIHPKDAIAPPTSVRIEQTTK